MSSACLPNDLSARLDAEWAALRRDPRVLLTVRRWGITAEPFRDLDEFLVLLGLRVPSTRDDNERLHAVLALAATDDLAARLVLQRIVPGLLARVRARGRGQRPGMFEELVGSAWIAIRTAHHARQCEQLGAALVSNAMHRSFVAPTRRRDWSELAVEPTVLDRGAVPEATSACEELAELLADARGAGLPEEDLALLRDLARAGSVAALAAERQVTPRTIRNHRARIAHDIRRCLSAAA